MTIGPAFLEQAKACEALGSPFNARLLRLVAARLEPGTPVADRLFAWPGDISHRGHSVPLRLAGALHRLVLTGADRRLTAVYPPNRSSDAALWGAVRGAIDDHAAQILAWLDSPPQTNEVRRAAVLIAVGHWLAAQFRLPMMLSELGASAGLNLNWDRFALKAGSHRLGPPNPALVLAPEWRGPPPQPSAEPAVAERRGVDLSPLNTDDPYDRTRLLSYLWPDQPERRALTLAAADIERAQVDRADAIDWLQGRLPQQPPGTLHLVYHTVAWQYFPASAQRRGHDLLQAAGNRATVDRPLAHLAMETDGVAPAALVTLTLWPGGATHILGRADFHGRWVDIAMPGALTGCTNA